MLDVLDFLGYMFFSTIEGFAVYALILYTFRYDLKRFFWHALLMIELVNLQSFITREEFSLSYISPIISLVTIMLFLTTIARIPIIWSMIISALGYISFALLQSIIVLLHLDFYLSMRFRRLPTKATSFKRLLELPGPTLAIKSSSLVMGLHLSSRNSNAINGKSRSSSASLSCSSFLSAACCILGTSI